MFRETITSADGSTEKGTCTEAHALNTLQRAVRLGYRVEATRTGGAVIVREIPTDTDYYRPPRLHTVTIEPAVEAGKITATNRTDLAIVAAHAGRSLTARLDAETGRINSGLNSIPPGAARRLIERGLVTVADDGAVTVSLAAKLAMLAQDHKTWTREPRGYVRPADIGSNSAGRCKGGGTGGMVYDRSSGVTCSCRGLSLPTEDRDDARRKARQHRQEVAAAMVRDLAA